MANKNYTKTHSITNHGLRIILPGAALTPIIDNFGINGPFTIKVSMLIALLSCLLAPQGLLNWLINTKIIQASVVINILLFAALLTSENFENDLRLVVALNLAVFVSSTCLYLLIIMDSKYLKIWIYFYVIFALCAHIYNVFNLDPSTIRSNLLEMEERHELLNTMASFTYVGHDLLPRFNFYNLDPNFANLALLLILVIINQKIPSEKTLMLIVLICILLTLSRTAMLAAATGLTISILLIFAPKLFATWKVRRKIFRIMLVVIIAIASISIYFFEIVSVRFGSVFNGYAIQDIRMNYIWPSYMHLFDNPLGHGFTFGHTIVGMHSHNMLIQLLLGSGIMGVITWLIIFNYALYKTIIGQRFLLTIFAIAFLILINSLDAIFMYSQWMIMLILIFRSKMELIK